VSGGMQPERATDAVLTALDQQPTELGQVLALLEAAGVAGAADLPVGHGDRQLLNLCRDLTGRDVEVVVDCPACGARNVAALGPDTFPPDHPRCLWWGPGAGLRAPTYRDLAGLPADPAGARAELLRRCVVGRPPRPPAAADFDLVENSLTGSFQAACVDCGEELEAVVDVQRNALELLAGRLERFDWEVHLLASTYQWKLATIERLPDERRRRLAHLIDEGR
jgi:hypothetical protein